MKKLILFIMFFNIFTMFSQKFELTPNGFVDSEDHTKNYLVLEFPNKTKEDLFKETLIYLNKTYFSPQDIISTVENETITITAVSSTLIRAMISEFYNQYSITLSFKDNKVKIDSPNVNLFTKTGYKLYISNGNDNVFNKKGQINYKRAKEGLELFANNFVLTYKLGMTTEKDTDW